MCFKNPEISKVLLPYPGDVIGCWKLRHLLSPASLISIFSSHFPPSPFPTLFPSLLFLLLFFPIFQGLGCHQQLSYPFPHSPTYRHEYHLSHEAKLEHEHRQNQAAFLIELLLLRLIHLKEKVCRKELSHWVGRIPSHSLWSVSPLPSLSLTTWGLKQTSPLAAWCHSMVKIIT